MKTSDVIVFALYIFTVSLNAVGPRADSEPIFSSLSDDLKDNQPEAGPSFVEDPPELIEFSNSSGTSIRCKVDGRPKPTTTWLLSDGSSVNNIYKLRRVTPEGTLHFLPFKADDYRQDVHSAIYRCSASNKVGTIISRNTRIKAVIIQPYDIYVYDTYAIKGNAAILTCHIPVFLEMFVQITSWLRDNRYVIRNSGNYSEENKYLILPNGDLFIREVDLGDHGSTYSCKTIHSLTNTTKISSTQGKLFVTDPHTNIPPRFVNWKNKLVTKENEKLIVLCLAQGNPVPKSSWFYKSNKHHLQVMNKAFSNGILIFESTKISDAGIYVCIVNNSVQELQAEMNLVVNAPTAVKVSPKNVIARIGESIITTCDVTGTSKPQIEWYKDGKQISTVNGVMIFNQTLTIHKIMANHKGMYQCFNKNSHGEMAYDTLQILLGDSFPEIKTSFNDQILHPGSSLSILCEATGIPLPHVTWRLDGTIPLNEFQSEIITNNSLYSWINASNIQPENGGFYSCTATNRIGSTSHTARISIYGPLQNRTPSQVSVIAGQDVILICPVFGYPVSRLQWHKDGNILPNSNRHRFFSNTTLLIKTVQKLIDSGRYDCTAQNSKIDEAKGSVDLTVQVPPKIIPFSFDDDLIRQRNRAQIQCSVSEGDSPLIIKWTKDGRQIPTQPGITILNLDEYSSILTISSINSKYNGNYTCHAANKAAESSYTAILSINVAPKISAFYFQEESSLEGSFARVTCHVYQGDLPITLSWYKNSRPLSSDPEVKVRSIDDYSSILTIENVHLKHSGDYTCVANNSAATVNHTANLIVYVPPRWKIIPKDEEIVKGKSVLIHCQAEGFPHPIISWKKALGDIIDDNQEDLIENSHINMFPNGSLKINDVTEKDDGYFLCYASNGIGIILSRAIRLKVHTPVYFKVNKSTSTVKINTKAVLQCDAYGDQPIHFKWFKNGEVLSETLLSRFKETTKQGNNFKSTSKFSIFNVTKPDEGIYYCTAKNKYGNSTTRIDLEIQEYPTSPEIKSFRNLGNRSVEIIWSDIENEKRNILKYILKFKRKQDSWTSRSQSLIFEPNTKTAKIHHLQAATVYEFKLAAENNVGLGKFSEIITLIVDEEAPEGPPLNVAVESVDPHSLRVSWKAPKKNLWNGIVRGYNIGYKIHNSANPYTFTTVEVPEDYTDDIIYQISDLEVFTKYSIIIQAYNNKGIGPNSEAYVVMTSEDIPSQPPKHLRCSSLSSRSVYVVWDPPPAEAIHGILRGYKVLYRPVTYKQNDVSLEKFNVTTSMKITLLGLNIDTNYSVQVLAFTHLGDGVKSEPVFCKTYEDVPGVPAAIKALPSSDDSILVSWMPPTNPNGAITKYNIYYTVIGDGEEPKDYPDKDSQKINVLTLDSTTKYFEIKGLQSTNRYAFWVTALSAIGEGPFSSVATQMPSSAEGPPRCASFDEEFVIHWKHEVIFPCQVVGFPHPERLWLHKNNEILRQNERIRFRFDGSLLIRDSNKIDSGIYTCEVSNKYGTDRIQYSLVVLVPPGKPVIELLSKTLNSVHFRWQQDDDGGNSIERFKLNYKKHNGLWQSIYIEPNENTYTLENLSCGSSYQFYLEAINAVGIGEQSESIVVTTHVDGKANETPIKESIIQEGSSYITVSLDSWIDGGCPVHHFILEYKTLEATDWVLFSKFIKVSQKKIVIPNLQSGSWYVLRVTAYTNEEDFTIREYIFSTLSLTRGTHLPEIFQNDDQIVLYYLDPWIFIPVVLLIIICIIVSVIVFVYFKKRTCTAEKPLDWPSYPGNLSNARNIRLSVENFVPVSKAQLTDSMSRRAVILKHYNSLGPNPYATIHLTENLSDVLQRDPQSIMNVSQGDSMMFPMEDQSDNSDKPFSNRSQEWMEEIYNNEPLDSPRQQRKMEPFPTTIFYDGHANNILSTRTNSPLKPIGSVSMQRLECERMGTYTTTDV